MGTKAVRAAAVQVPEITVATVYWFAVAVVAVFGTMAADGMMTITEKRDRATAVPGGY